jgi:DNA-binding NarL/FixJ family response regulator
VSDSACRPTCFFISCITAARIRSNPCENFQIFQLSVEKVFPRRGANYQRFPAGFRNTGVGRTFQHSCPGAPAARLILRDIFSTFARRSLAVTIVIVEDHLMFREVLRKVCVVELNHQVVGEADDGDLAVQVVRDTQPDLVLLDLHLPNLDGFGVVEAIRQDSPDTKVLVLSSHCDEYTVYNAERTHVNGFVDKNTNSVATLKDAIAAIARGRTWFSEPFLRLKAARQRDPRSFDKLLTKRESAILAMVGQSMTDEEIGARLEISWETVEKHRFNLLKKLELKSTVELARYAREHGFTLNAPRDDDGALLP